MAKKWAFTCGTNAVKPELPAQVANENVGFALSCPLLDSGNIIKIVIYSQSFHRPSCRLPATWFGLKSDWFVWISVTGVATRTSKKKKFKQAKIYVPNTCWYISLPPRHDYDVKCRGTTFNRGCNCKTFKFSFSWIGTYMGNNSIPGEFGFIGKIEWGRIMAIKLLKKKRNKKNINKYLTYHIKSNVFTTVFVLFFSF